MRGARRSRVWPTGVTAYLGAFQAQADPGSRLAPPDAMIRCTPALVAVNVVRPVGRSTLTALACRRGGWGAEAAGGAGLPTEPKVASCSGAARACNHEIAVRTGAATLGRGFWLACSWCRATQGRWVASTSGPLGDVAMSPPGCSRHTGTGCSRHIAARDGAPRHGHGGLESQFDSCVTIRRVGLTTEEGCVTFDLYQVEALGASITFSSSSAVTTSACASSADASACCWCSHRCKQ